MDRWTRAVNATLLTLFVFTVATGALAFGSARRPSKPSSWEHTG